MLLCPHNPDSSTTQNNEMSSGGEQVQRAVVILYPINGIAEFKGHHANQVCYKSGIMLPNTQSFGFSK
jgi:hypothetical protein